MNESFDKRILYNILINNKVLFSWCFIADRDLEDTVLEKCLSQIARKWITIKGFSFAKHNDVTVQMTFQKGNYYVKLLISTYFIYK